ncbi:MAG TPA: GHMP kinase [Thermoanaerobacterales bacterium]|nr:GHMP kinase [Thermoanaerobacterales bacterium]
MWGKARCPASCGEIVQGNIRGKDFLITCPISLYTEVDVKLVPKKTNSSDDCDEFYDKKSYKSYLAALKTLHFFKVEGLKPVIKINTQIPRGIGLSSSTADITATCMATASAAGRYIFSGDIADIALSIEPSDGVMFSGAVIFDHIKGTWKESLGSLPDMDVYIIDTGETVDTKEFNSRKDLLALNQKKEARVMVALEMARSAIKKGDVKLLGEAMIMSAMAHQEILYKYHLENIIESALKFGAVGVNIAHSGSAMGLFFEKNCRIDNGLWKELDRVLKHHTGGYRIIKTCIDNRGPVYLIGGI